MQYNYTYIALCTDFTQPPHPETVYLSLGLRTINNRTSNSLLASHLMESTEATKCGHLHIYGIA